MEIFAIDYIYENALTSKEKNGIPDSEFGIPSLRKYPLNDEEHIRLAIKFFNYVDKPHERELAKNIMKKIIKNGIEVHVGPGNRFKKYYEKGIKYAKSR